MNTEENNLRLLKIYQETETIESQLPIEIDNMTIDKYLLRCSDCNQSINPKLIHGYASKPLEDTATFQTFSICQHCETITERVQRLKKTSKNRISIQRLTKNGKWEQSDVAIDKGTLYMAELKRKVISFIRKHIAY